MFKLSVFLFLFGLLSEDVDGCIPMRIIDPITIPVTTTTLIPPQSCPTPPGAAAIYIEDGVEFGEKAGFFKTDPIGTCINSTKGDITYYDGGTSVNFDENGGPVYVGLWMRGNCATPCICTATACYTPVPGGINPQLNLLPHCQTPQNCFVAVVFSSPGSLVNVLNPTDMFSMAAQDASGTADITDPSYPKVTQIGCSSCPLMVN